MTVLWPVLEILSVHKKLHEERRLFREILNDSITIHIVIIIIIIIIIYYSALQCPALKV